MKDGKLAEYQHEGVDLGPLKIEMMKLEERNPGIKFEKYSLEVPGVVPTILKFLT